MKITFPDKQIVDIDTEEVDLLQVCYDNDTPINFGCRIGMCGTCKIAVVEGIENVSEKNKAEKDLTTEPNERLACQCTIRGDVKIDRP